MGTWTQAEQTYRDAVPLAEHVEATIEGTMATYDLTRREAWQAYARAYRQALKRLKAEAGRKTARRRRVLAGAGGEAVAA